MPVGQEFRPFREIDYKTACFLLDRTEDSPLKRARERRRLDKAYRSKVAGFDASEPPMHRWWRCEARFWHGDYSDWSGWEYRDPWAARIWFENPFPVKVWDTKPVDRLYVVGEQGIGDEVLFSQCLLNLPAKEVVLETQDRLIPVFERMGVKCVPSKLVPHPDGEGELRLKQDFDADAWVALGDLPRLYRKAPEMFPRKPYLPFPLSPGGRTGISWRGAQGAIPELLKAFPKALALQYDIAWDEDVNRPDLDLRNDLDGLCRLLATLKRVVTVSTSVAHFSAALGIETHVILAPNKSGRRGNLIPWKWHAENLPGRSWWYPDTTRTYDSWAQFASSGMGRALLAEG